MSQDRVRKPGSASARKPTKANARQIRYFMPGELIVHVEAHDGLPPIRTTGELQALQSGIERLAPASQNARRESDVASTRPVYADTAGPTGNAPGPISIPIGPTAALVPMAVRGSDSDLLALMRTLTRAVAQGAGGAVVALPEGRVITLRAASPNWLVGAAGGETIGTGGPADKPKSALAADAAAALTFPALERALLQQPIDVYVLDTLAAPPGDSDAKGKSAAWSEAARKVPLGKAWLGKWHANRRNADVHVSADRLLTRQAAPSVMLPTPTGAKVPGQDFDMAWHGPFAASLIRRVSHNARIHLIEVLNAQGTGTLASVAWGLSQVAERQPHQGGLFLINCSFTFAIPVNADGLKVSGHDQTGLPADWQDWLANGGQAITAEMLEGLFGHAVRDRQQGLIFAAAGNDSNESVVFAARYPAWLPSVVGVGALTESGQRAAYSNAPDSPIQDGLMTQGTATGLYLGALPGGKPNLTGQAVWSGTSFATPIITGAVARLVSQSLMTPAQALAKLRSSQPELESTTLGEVVTSRRN